MERKLEHSRLFRGGITAPVLLYERTEFTIGANIKDQALDLRFRIKSKGAGYTALLHQIKREDIPMLLEEVAKLLREPPPK